MIDLQFNLCQVRNFDGDTYPHTLSEDNIKILPNVQYPYSYVQIEPTAEYDTEIFMIYIDGGWHQAQSIDFEY